MCCRPWSPPVTGLGAADHPSTGTPAPPSSAALVPVEPGSRAAFPSRHGSQQALLRSRGFSTLQGSAERFTVVVAVGFGHQVVCNSCRCSGSQPPRLGFGPWWTEAPLWHFLLGESSLCLQPFEHLLKK